MGMVEGRLADIATTLVEIKQAIVAADRGRNDALSAVGSIKSRLDRLAESIGTLQCEAPPRNEVKGMVAELRKAIQAQDVAIQGLTNRLEANEQAVQSCLSTLDELNKMVRTIAGKLPPDRPHIQFPQPIP